jgi:hypothetical protein
MQHMNPDPLSVALREVTECKRLLETLLTSSETFDYPKAKVALKQINRKMRELAKLQKQWQGELKRSRPAIHVLDFSKPEAQAQV